MKKTTMVTKASTSHKLVLGDVLEELDQLEDKVNLVFADPPYNIGKKFGQNNSLS